MIEEFGMSAQSWWREAHALESLFFQKSPSWRQFVTRRAVRDEFEYLLFEVEICSPPPGKIMMKLSIAHFEQEGEDPEQILGSMAIFSKAGAYLSSTQYGFEGEQSPFWRVIEGILNEHYIFLVKFSEGEVRSSKMFSIDTAPDLPSAIAVGGDVIVRSWLGKFDLGDVI